jgi:phosphoenolpyruvate carboxykinase (ATP)
MDDVSYNTHKLFPVLVPESCPGVPAPLLDPKKTWADPDQYERTAVMLRDSFEENSRQFPTIANLLPHTVF